MLIKGPFEFLGLFTEILHRLTNTANVGRLREKRKEE